MTERRTKILTALLLIGALLFCSFPAANAATAILGDADLDYELTAADARTILLTLMDPPEDAGDDE